jgi:hypothetical protein
VVKRCFPHLPSTTHPYVVGSRWYVGGRLFPTHPYEAVKNSRTGDFGLCNPLKIQVGAHHGVPLRGFFHSFYVVGSRWYVGGRLFPTHPYVVGSRSYVGGCFSPPTICNLPHTEGRQWAAGRRQNQMFSPPTAYHIPISFFQQSLICYHHFPLEIRNKMRRCHGI